MTHTGKIGRLPKTIRDQLGQRLEDNLPGKEIVRWLNSQVETRRILIRHFGGRPVTEQNLSEWRQSGHQQWLRRQEALANLRTLLEDAQDLEQLADGQNLSHSFAAILAAEMATLAKALLEPETDPEKKWERLCQIHRELSRLRRDDDSATRTAIQKERWLHQSRIEHEEELERKEKAHKEKLINILMETNEKAVNARIFGGGERGKNMAEALYRIKCDLPALNDLMDETGPQASAATPPTSEPPQSTESARSTSSTSSTPSISSTESPSSPQTTSEPPANPEQSDQIRPNPTKSNQIQPNPTKSNQR